MPRVARTSSAHSIPTATVGCKNLSKSSLGIAGEDLPKFVDKCHNMAADPTHLTNEDLSVSIRGTSSWAGMHGTSSSNVTCASAFRVADALFYWQTKGGPNVSWGRSQSLLI